MAQLKAIVASYDTRLQQWICEALMFFGLKPFYLQSVQRYNSPAD